eukprot:jgi/Astpho2/8887/Aster-x0830
MAGMFKSRLHDSALEKVSRLKDAADTEQAQSTAVQHSDFKVLHEMLQHNPSLAADAQRYHDGATALHIGANEGNVRVLKALVEAFNPFSEVQDPSPKAIAAFRKQLNCSNMYGQTALMLACKNGHADCVEFLLNQGADAMLKDKIHCRTCLHYAAWNGWSQCIDILLSHPSTQNPTDGEASGRNPAFRDMANIRSESGFTPLHFAVSGGNISAVKALLQYGASCNVQVGEGTCYAAWPVGSTPLHIAAAKGALQIIRAMLQAQVTLGEAAGLDPRMLKDAMGRNPHRLALEGGHENCLSLLDPGVPLAEAVLRKRLRHGALSLKLLAGRAVHEQAVMELILIESRMVPPAEQQHAQQAGEELQQPQ